LRTQPDAAKKRSVRNSGVPLRNSRSIAVALAATIRTGAGERPSCRTQQGGRRFRYSPGVSPASTDFRSLVRTIPDHPKPGIQFRDITTLIADPAGLASAVDALADPHLGAAEGPQVVAGIEARGFLFGTALAVRLGLGFLPLRKPGKLPGETLGRDYHLEYGTDRIELHVGAIRPGQRVLLVDDLIATGGTAEAAVLLLREAGAEVVECAFVIDLPDLGGTTRLEKLGCSVRSLCAFPGE